MGARILPITIEELRSGGLLVATGLIGSHKFLRWLRDHDKPGEEHSPNVTRAVMLMKFWLEAVEQEKMTLPCLQQLLGHWLVAHMDAGALGHLEYKGVEDP